MIRDYKPLSRLKWNSETIKAFEEVKAAINACPKLHFLDDTPPKYLHGVGAYLSQVVDRIEVLIKLLSQTLKAEQNRLSAADNKCYATVYAFKHFEHLITDRSFVLRTDYKNLTYLYLENSGEIRR